MKRYTQSDFIYKGLLLYTFLAYTQFAGRYPVFAPLRLEFIVGLLTLTGVVIKFVNRELAINENKATLSVILFLATCALTIPFAFVKDRAIENFVQLLKFVSIYFMIISCIINRERIKVFIYLYLFLIGIIFIEPFSMYLIGDGLRYSNYMMRLHGVTGFYENPNQLGGVVSANLPFYYYMIFHHKSWWKRVIFIILTLTGIWVVFLTQSRTAFIGVVSAAAVITIRHGKIIKGIIACLIICTILWFFAPEDTKSRFLTMARSGDIIRADEEIFAGNHEIGSMNSRWILIKHSLIVFSENPIFGVGIGCFFSVSGNRWGSWYQTHNLYTEALSEIGIIGTATFLYFIFCVSKNLKISDRNSTKDGIFAINKYLTDALYAVLFTRLAVGMFGHDLYRDWWFVIAGLSVVNLKIIDLSKKNSRLFIETRQFAK